LIDFLFRGEEESEDRGKKSPSPDKGSSIENTDTSESSSTTRQDRVSYFKYSVANS
jgi:hypothetical protein